METKSIPLRSKVYNFFIWCIYVLCLLLYILSKPLNHSDESNDLEIYYTQYDSHYDNEVELYDNSQDNSQDNKSMWTTTDNSSEYEQYITPSHEVLDL